MDPDAYMRTMTVGTGSKITPEQWGGFFEASVMAHHYHIRVAIFNKVLDSDGRANFTPVITFGHQQAESLKGTIAVAYNGNHYSVLKISPDIIKALTWVHVCFCSNFCSTECGLQLLALPGLACILSAGPAKFERYHPWKKIKSWEVLKFFSCEKAKKSKYGWRCVLCTPLLPQSQNKNILTITSSLKGCLSKVSIFCQGGSRSDSLIHLILPFLFHMLEGGKGRRVVVTDSLGVVSAPIFTLGLSVQRGQLTSRNIPALLPQSGGEETLNIWAAHGSERKKKKQGVLACHALDQCVKLQGFSRVC